MPIKLSHLLSGSSTLEEHTTVCLTNPDWFSLYLFWTEILTGLAPVKWMEGQELVELTTEFTLVLLMYIALCSLICSLKTILRLLCFSNSKYQWHYD